MAFGGLARASGTQPQSEINMIPLIDVMLVLLVIFMVTAPLLTHSVTIELPRAASARGAAPPDTVQISITADGQLFWNSERVEAHELGARLEAAARLSSQPQLQIRADRATPYENVARVMAAAARAGVARIGFIADPRDAGQ